MEKPFQASERNDARKEEFEGNIVRLEGEIDNLDKNCLGLKSKVAGILNEEEKKFLSRMLMLSRNVLETDKRGDIDIMKNLLKKGEPMNEENKPDSVIHRQQSLGREAMITLRSMSKSWSDDDKF